MRRGIAVLDDLADGAGVHGYPGADYDNRVYYVNNITGDSSYSGLDSWDNAMDEVSTAITAWEAYRATRTSTDAYRVLSMYKAQEQHTQQ
jgi:hypothetical protein